MSATSLPDRPAPDLAVASAYDYPLIIKQLLVTPLRQYPNQEIVYLDPLRFTYRQFGYRMHHLGSALGTLGVKHGDTGPVMDWDSHHPARPGCRGAGDCPTHGAVGIDDLT